MMKKILLFLLPITLLSGCQKNNEPSHKEPHYQEVEEYHIEWKDIFSQQQDKYYVYVYSIACPQCSALREDITNIAKKGFAHLYFVYPDDDIAFTRNEEEADNSLGASSLENVYIYTTPTLMEFTNKEITSYTRDY